METHAATLPRRVQRGRSPTDPRRVLDALLYLVKGGCPWRLLPKSFPPWQTVYHGFRRRCHEGTGTELNARLRAGGLGWLKGLNRPWVNGGYAGPDFAAAARGHRSKLVVEVVKRSATAQGFEVRPQHWLVERTFGWRMRHRRLVRNDERTESSAEGWGYLARIRIRARRLTCSLSSHLFQTDSQPERCRGSTAVPAAHRIPIPAR